MKHDTASQKLEKLARQELDYSIQNLDQQTLAKLKAARKNAVDIVAKNNAKQGGWDWISNGWLLPVGGLATTAFAVTMTVSIWLIEPNELDQLSPEDIEVLSANEDYELFDELEFYQWLDDEKQSRS